LRATGIVIMIAPIRTDSESEEESGREAHERSSRRHAPADGNPFEPVLRHVAELREYFVHYWTVQKDAARATARRVLLWTILGLVAGIVALALLVSAAALALIGLSDALGVVFGERYWAGKLVVGLGVILLSFGGLGLGLYGWSRSSRKNTVQQYERRHSQQRARFGRDIHQRAGAAYQRAGADMDRKSGAEIHGHEAADWRERAGH
jgi:hypothetical protein